MNIEYPTIEMPAQMLKKTRGTRVIARYPMTRIRHHRGLAVARFLVLGSRS